MSSSSNFKPTNTNRIYKNNLPHWDFPGHAYFITISTYSDLIFSNAEKDIVFNAVRFHDGAKYKLYACVVMPTHLHVIVLPLEESKSNYYSLAQIIHSIKSYTTNEIQKVTGKKGRIWLDEAYDRIIRNDNDFLQKMNYIMNNPVKAGLVGSLEDYKWLYYCGLG